MYMSHGLMMTIRYIAARMGYCRGSPSTSSIGACSLRESYCAQSSAHKMTWLLSSAQTGLLITVCSTAHQPNISYIPTIIYGQYLYQSTYDWRQTSWLIIHCIGGKCALSLHTEITALQDAHHLLIV